MGVPDHLRLDGRPVFHCRHRRGSPNLALRQAIRICDRRPHFPISLDACGRLGNCMGRSSGFSAAIVLRQGSCVSRVAALAHIATSGLNVVASLAGDKKAQKVRPDWHGLEVRKAERRLNLYTANACNHDNCTEDYSSFGQCVLPPVQGAVNVGGQHLRLGDDAMESLLDVLTGTDSASYGGRITNIRSRAKIGAE